jgi:type II secretory ATPase GspE/PulE/Tfp pilus assembly ATPase PilB-like protein
MLKKFDRVLYEALIEKGVIPKKTLDSLRNEAETSGERLKNLLLRRVLLSEKDILDILAGKLKLATIDLKKISIDISILNKVPVKIASYYRFIPVKMKGKTLTIAADSPLDLKTQDDIRTQLGCDIELILSSTADITESLQRYYGLGADTLEKITSQQVSTPKTAPQEGIYEKLEDIEKLADEASVIKLVNQIILEGWRKRATDIHIEPHRGKVALRYRIDGVLYDAAVPSEMKNFLSSIISRIKIMSNLNIVERRVPQDGRAVVRVQNQVLDLRISTLPTPFGESIVIRILPTQMLFSLEKLGLSKRELEVFEKLILKPYGIIFVTGPTGSGKTTTLYACLSEINTKERKIVTIEDPIEYEMADIIQMQVMPDISLDFARGLRSILRHDPDIMMIGEVRDLETAEIAIRVALTGHLIFSTLHTNDAASAITRLIDIGIEPYLIASSVEAFIAQRLVRVICPECKYEDKKALQELKDVIAGDLGIRSEETKVFRGRGCPKCNNTGFFGRTAIYEILLVDTAIKGLILKKMPSSEIKKMALSKGMRTLRQDGWHKTINGVTTPEEVMKVTSAEDETEGKKMEGEKREKPFNANLPKEMSSRYKKLEKRIYGRLKDKINLRYKVFRSKEELHKRGIVPEQYSVTKNISAGGVVFISSEMLPLGSILELNIELPNTEKSVECLAKVVRVEEIEAEKAYDIAVYFLDITGAQRAILNKYVELEK